MQIQKKKKRMDYEANIDLIRALDEQNQNTRGPPSDSNAPGTLC